MSIKADLLTVAAAYCRITEKSEARVSTEVFRAGHCLRRLREGGDMRSGGIERGLQWFSDRWPEGEPWPCDVPRPARSPSAPTPSSAAPAGPPT